MLKSTKIFFIFCLLFPPFAFGQEIEKLEAKLKSQPSNTKLREQLAEGYANSKKYDKVIELLNPYTDMISLASYLNLAAAYSEKSDFENQVRVLKLLVAKDENSHQSHFILGHALIKLADTKAEELKKRKVLEEAVASFRTSIRNKVDYKPAYDALLDVFIRNRNNYESRAILADMIKQFGKRPEFYNDLCRLYSVDGFIDQALENCKIGIKTAPKFPDNYVYLASSYYDQKDKEKAAKTLSFASRKFKESEFVQRSTGEFYSKQKNFPVAVRYFQQALKINEKSASAQLGMANAMFESGQRQESLVHYQQACALDSSLSEELLSAAGKLRQLNDLILASKFSSAAYACKTK